MHVASKMNDIKKYGSTQTACTYYLPIDVDVGMAAVAYQVSKHGLEAQLIAGVLAL